MYNLALSHKLLRLRLWHCPPNLRKIQEAPQNKAQNSPKKNKETNKKTTTNNKNTPIHRFSSVESHSKVESCNYSDIQSLCFYTSTFYFVLLTPLGEKNENPHFSDLIILLNKTVEEQFSMYLGATQKTSTKIFCVHLFPHPS